MSHVSNRMTMLKFQNNRPYNARSCGGFGGGYGLGYNNSIFGYMRPMGFGCNNSLARAGFWTNFAMDCADWGMNFANQIRNWCGGGGGQQTTPTDTDLTLLQNTLKDTDKLDYEVVKNSDGTYSVTVRDKEHPENNKYFSGTKESILKELGYTNGPSQTTKTDGNEPTAKPTADGVKTKIKAALNLPDGDKNRIGIPDGFDTNVAVTESNGTITVTVKSDENHNYQEFSVTGKTEEEIVTNLRNKCTELRTAQAQAYEKSSKMIDSEDNKEKVNEITQAIASKGLPQGSVLNPSFAQKDDGTFVGTLVVCVGDNVNDVITSKNGDKLIAESFDELLALINKYEAPEAEAEVEAEAEAEEEAEEEKEEET